MASKLLESAHTAVIVVFGPIAVCLAVILDPFLGWSSYGAATPERRRRQRWFVAGGGVALATLVGVLEGDVAFAGAILAFTLVTLLLLELGRGCVVAVRRLAEAHQRLRQESRRR